ARWLKWFYLNVLKWFLIICVVGAGAMVLSTSVVLPKLKSAISAPGVDVVQDPNSGRNLTYYSDDMVPDGLQEELEAPAATLIYEQQQRSLEGHSDEGPSAHDSAAPQPERQALVNLASRFLTQWETFSA